MNVRVERINKENFELHKMQKEKEKWYNPKLRFDFDGDLPLN